MAIWAVVLSSIAIVCFPISVLVLEESALICVIPLCLIFIFIIIFTATSFDWYSRRYNKLTSHGSDLSDNA